MRCFVVARTRDLFFTINSADFETPKKVGKYNINSRKVSAVLHDMISNVLLWAYYSRYRRDVESHKKFRRTKISRVEFRLWIGQSRDDSWRPHLVTLPPLSEFTGCAVTRWKPKSSLEKPSSRWRYFLSSSGCRLSSSLSVRAS